MDSKRAGKVDQAGELRSARVESLRALAALGVFAGHVYGTAHGYNPFVTLGDFQSRLLLGGGFGVYLFFALSGYLLYWPFAKRDFGMGRRIDLSRYARNRALRILPLYYVSVVVVLLLQEGGGTVKQWLLFTTFSENYSAETVGKINGVLWSLVVELHFYLLLPLLAVGVARLARGSLRRAALLIAGLGAASFALRLGTFYLDETPDPYLRYSVLSTFMFFTAGMLLAPLRLSWERRGGPRLPAPLASGWAWIVGSATLWLVVAYDYDLEALAAAAGFLLVGACVLPLRQSALVRALEWRPLAAVGIASYSLYVWHVPILNGIGDVAPGRFLVLMAVAAPVCIGAAFASYAFVEAPFLRLRRRWGSTVSRTPEARPEPGLPAPAAATAE